MVVTAVAEMAGVMVGARVVGGTAEAMVAARAVAAAVMEPAAAALEAPMGLVAGTAVPNTTCCSTLHERHGCSHCRSTHHS